MFTGFWLRLYYFHVALFHAALFPCCTFSMLHFFHVALFHVALFHVALFSCCNFLCYIHVAFFSLSMLHLFIIEKYWQLTEDRKHNQKATLHLAPLTFSLLFWYSITHFLSLYSYESLIKWKGTNLQFCWKRMFAKAWKF